MTIYRYDSDGYYIGATDAELNRVATRKLGVDTYFTYPNSTTKAPLKEKEGYRVKWTGSIWGYEAIPEPEPVEEEQPQEDPLREAHEAERYLSSTDWVDTKIDELYKLKLTEVHAKYGSMTKAAWDEAITYLATLQGKYATVLQKRAEARNTINGLMG